MIGIYICIRATAKRRPEDNPIPPRSSFSLLWQTFRLCGRHSLPFFAIGGLPWAVFALISILLGQDGLTNLLGMVGMTVLYWEEWISGVCLD